MSNTLENFKVYLKKMSRYDHIISLMYWDMSTITPKCGFEGQVDALTYFSTERFAMGVSDELTQMLDTLASPDEFGKLDDTMKFVVKRMKRDLDKEKRIPKDFYESFVNEQALSKNAWEKAKNASDFSLFAPHLEKMIEMTKKRVEYTDPGKDVYNTLLDLYEEGMDVETIDRLFNDLKKELVPLVKKVIAADQPDDSKFEGCYDITAQKKVELMLLDYIGFNLEKGTVGEVEHPFTLELSQNDVRVSNHFHENDPLSAMFSAIHEGGHGIFEQNINPEYAGTVAGSCCYMGLHESQSRFFENILGRNKNFWVPIYSKLSDFLPKYKAITLDEFYHKINHVKNSFIRTEADELTYCLHIIIRYEIEKAIFYDGISVSELPSLWNKKMEEYLGITPADDKTGILQDMHWSDGSFGYFPSYLLGNIYDGMFLEKIEKELGSIDKILAEGRIHDITKWLNKNIHVYGSTRTSNEVLAAICGQEVSAEPIINYFTEKYTKIYNL